MKNVLLAIACIIATQSGSGQQWVPLPSGTPNLLQSVWFTDAQNGWAVGDVGTAVHTTDGGQSWSPANITNQDLEDVMFLNPSIGLMVGDDGLVLRTVTGGISWTIATTGTSTNLRTVSFGEGGMAYIGGRDGVILRSVDEGASWIIAETGTVRYRGSAARGPQHAWIVGDGGVIRATTDAGLSWFPRSGGTTSDLHGVFFLNTSEGWIGGQNSTLLHTDNGGTSWVPRNTGITQGVDAVFFQDSNNGWAVGNAGAIFRTTNGGLNWVGIPSGTANELNDVFFLANGQGWIVGDNGTILFYDGTTSVGDDWVLPEKTLLYQNYPNPFNPETVIRYTLAKPSRVSLVVYNLIGQQLASLVNTRQNAGDHSVRFDASGLPSGVYVYKLTQDDVLFESRKMTVVR